MRSSAQLKNENAPIIEIFKNPTIQQRTFFEHQQFSCANPTRQRTLYFRSSHLQSKDKRLKMHRGFQNRIKRNILDRQFLSLQNFLVVMSEKQ